MPVSRSLAWPTPWKESAQVIEFEPARSQRYTPLVGMASPDRRSASRTSIGEFVALRRSLDPEVLHPELKAASVEAQAVWGPARPGQGPSRLLQGLRGMGCLGPLRIVRDGHV